MTVWAAGADEDRRPSPATAGGHLWARRLGFSPRTPCAVAPDARDVTRLHGLSQPLHHGHISVKIQSLSEKSTKPYDVSSIYSAEKGVGRSHARQENPVGTGARRPPPREPVPTAAGGSSPAG